MGDRSDWRAQWETLRRLRGRARWAHLWEYYKLPIALFLILLYLMGYTVFRIATHKEAALYVALVNVSVGEETEGRLTRDYLAYRGLDEQRCEVIVYRGLTLSESDEVDRQYVYASEMKLLAAINAETLDVVVMDETARDIFERNEYLSPLSGPFSSESVYALDVSSAPCMAQAGFTQPVYLGILANSPRADAAHDYILYLENAQ